LITSRPFCRSPIASDNQVVPARGHSSIEAWPDGLPAGYADDICKLQTAKYKLNACALIVACDGTTKIIVCERVAQSETAHCTCTLNDSSGRTPTSSEIPDVLGKAIDPCVNAFDICRE